MVPLEYRHPTQKIGGEALSPPPPPLRPSRRRSRAEENFRLKLSLFLLLIMLIVLLIWMIPSNRNVRPPEDVGSDVVRFSDVLK